MYQILKKHIYFVLPVCLVACSEHISVVEKDRLGKALILELNIKYFDAPFIMGQGASD